MASPHATAAKKGERHVGWTEEEKVKEKMERQRKQRAGKQAHTGLITLTLTGGRMEGGRMDGGREGAECCKTNPYWKSSLVLRAERSAWSQRACVCVCVLNRLRPLESPRSAK